MTQAPSTPPQEPNRTLVILSLISLYILWGSTYLGIRYALEGFPPFLLNGIRLVIAGVLIYPIALRGRSHPTAVQWRAAALTGSILFIGGMGFVAVAEDLGVGSGIVASAVAVMPLWAALWSGLFGRWPTRLEWIGLVIGFAGVALLSQEGDFRASTPGLILMILSPLLWAFGSILAGRVRLPGGLMTAATQMLTGGVATLALALVLGERITEPPSTTAWVALVYLIIAGSLLGYTAYAYLLATVRPALATSYAYVNPVVAVILGVTIGGEVIGVWTLAGLPFILVGVALVLLAQRSAARHGPSG